MAFEKILAYTRNNFPVDAPVFEEAVVSWKTRNSDYLKFSKRLIEADKKIARSPSFDKETRDSCRQIVEVLIPNGADRFANTLIGSINDLKPVSTAENLLIDFIDSIKKGKWDVAVRDPELAGFMDVKIKELKSESQW